MTETFAIGRSSTTSPFRHGTPTESEDFVLPVEPQFSPPGEDLRESYPVSVELVPDQEADRLPVQGPWPFAEEDELGMAATEHDWADRSWETERPFERVEVWGEEWTDEEEHEDERQTQDELETGSFEAGALKGVFPGGVSASEDVPTSEAGPGEGEDETPFEELGAAEGFRRHSLNGRTIRPSPSPGSIESSEPLESWDVDNLESIDAVRCRLLRQRSACLFHRQERRRRSAGRRGSRRSGSWKDPF